MYIEVGPASLVITGEKDGRPRAFARQEVESLVAGILREIGECLPVLRQRACRIKNASHLPEVAKRMTQAAKMVDEATLTPMAAVAGAVADMVKEHFRMEGFDLLTVNNGGDLSIYNRTGRRLKVGIGDIITGKAAGAAMTIEGIHDLGLATSGFGGRSLTLGIADAVTAIGKTAAIADAAATFICNRTAIVTDTVVRKKAYLVDPETDIPDEDVTVSVGTLPPGLIADALENGLVTARALKERGVIDDAALLLKGNIVTTIDVNNKHITMEVQDGNQKDRHHR